jgi:hypothetical protein
MSISASTLCTINWSGFLYRDKHLTMSFENEFASEGDIFMVLSSDEILIETRYPNKICYSVCAVNCILCERGIFFLREDMVKVL